MPMLFKLLGGLIALVVFLCMATCTAIVLLLSVPDPVALFFSIWAAIIPAVIYSSLVLYLDRYETEPWYLLLSAFLWGAVVAVFLAISFEILAGQAVLVAWGEDTADLVGITIAAPVFEELTKGAALVVLVIFFRNEFDGALDGIVYGALIGLGFAMTENILYFGSVWVEDGAVAFGFLFFLRAILGGFGHAFYTATFGATIGWAVQRPDWSIRRVLVPACGLLLAISQHAAWNSTVYALSRLDEDTATVAGLLLFFVVEPLLFTLPPLLIFLVVATVAGRRELRIIRQELYEEINFGILASSEVTMLTDRRIRRSASWNAFWSGGPVRWLRLRQFNLLAGELAFQKHHSRSGRQRKRGVRQRDADAIRYGIATARIKLAETYGWHSV